MLSSPTLSELPSPDALVIGPPQRFPRPNLAELWNGRLLLYFLLWRNVKIRYKQTAFGVAWAVIQPATFVLVFSFTLGVIIGAPAGIPYPIFVLTGLVPWTFFSAAVSLGTQSLVANTGLVTKVYFPRVTLPLSSVLTPLLDFGIALMLTIVLMLVFGVVPSIWMVTLPALVLFLVLLSTGIALWLAAMNVRYRDVGYAVPFLIQIWMFATPVFYPATFLPRGVGGAIFRLNPMVGVIALFRWALLGTPIDPFSAVVAALGTAVVLLTGWVYFLRTEQSFADVI